ncbi:MAG TPA: DNA-3-methyladenine glycosylase 2 family protein [Steroidobacteraceae bacterium]|nr:DNA-3-methyladenine glycosylase 2 family protein [Steroidobacteraceae bacterium]HNS26513.1 DNA-3-methyladenine glycosylase 2 family protein [Steroidobacteraceae bacterium]
MRKHFAARDPVMAALIRAAGPYRLAPEGARSPFESLARAITHQQLNGIAAERILGRFVALCGSGAFPEPGDVLARPDHELRAVGLSFAKIASLKDLAAKTGNGIVPHGAALATLSDAQIIDRLTQVRGIGRWTVEMLLIFQLGRPDVLPVDDFGVRNGFRLAYGLRGMPTPRALAAFGERWAPHRTAAAWYLWRAVDIAKLGKLPAPVAKPRGIRIVKRKSAAGNGAPRKPAVRKGAAGSARKKSAAATGLSRAASTRAARGRRGRSRR